MTYGLWILQILLGLLFLFSGSMKFVMSVAEMTKDMPWMPGWFLHFIGVMEILGGFGLILPSLLRIRPGLTPLAAACLVIIMIGATVITLSTMGVGAAVLPLIVGILCVFVAYGRWRLAPLSARS
jgi:putative oxidoreductase